MMTDDHEKWIDDAFESIKGLTRASPPSDLFTRLESRIDNPTSNIILIRRLRIASAAAVFLLLLNVFALRHYAKESREGWSEVETNGQQLISDYKIYEP